VIVFIAIAIAFGALTARRNTDYRSAISIWQDNIAKRPDSPRPYGDWPARSLMPGASPKRSLLTRTAVRLLPNYPKVHHNYGVALAAAADSTKPPRNSGSRSHQLPTLADAHYELGNVRHEQGRNAEALACYEAAIRLLPDFALAITTPPTSSPFRPHRRGASPLRGRSAARTRIFPMPNTTGPILSPSNRSFRRGRAALRILTAARTRACFRPPKIAASRCLTSAATLTRSRIRDRAKARSRERKHPRQPRHSPRAGRALTDRRPTSHV